MVRRKLAPGGVFITQSGPAGVLSATEVFSSIFATVRSVFPRVVPYAQHIPSFCDCWGFSLALTDAGTPPPLSPEEFDRRAKLRIDGELVHVDGQTFAGVRMLNKVVRKALEQETEVYTLENARFIHGHGTKDNHASPASPTAVASAAEVVAQPATPPPAAGKVGKALNGHMNGMLRDGTERLANGVPNGIAH